MSHCDVPQKTSIVKTVPQENLKGLLSRALPLKPLMLELGSKNLKISELPISFEKLEKQQWNKLKESETKEVIHKRNNEIGTRDQQSQTLSLWKH